MKKRMTRMGRGPAKRILLLLFLYVTVSFSSSFAADFYSSDFSYPLKARFVTQISTEHRKSFYMDYLFPLYYPEDKTTLVFFNPKQTWHDPSSDELNLGLGIRKIFQDSFILGIHCFYDKKRSTTDAVHYQRGYGAEYLSEYLDVRFNYYDPVNKPRVVDEGYEFGETGMLQWNSLEEPLEGFDFEIGVPLLPKKLNTRFYVGGFFYDSNLAEDVEGVRVRTETAFADWLSLDLTMDSRNKQETNFIAGLRVTVPFELGNIPYKMNPIEPQYLPYLEERLFERVVRDIDVQTGARAVKVSSPAPLTIGQGIVVENMLFVDNSRAPGGDGSISRPYNTLADAFADPRFGDGMCIFIFKGDGTATGYTGHYTLSSQGVTIWGDGYSPVMGCGGGGHPLIDGGGAGTVFTLEGNNNAVLGVSIQNADVGVYGKDVEGMSVKNSVMSGLGGDGVTLISSGGNTASATVSGNTITNNDYGVGIESYDSSVMTAVISDNTITGNTQDGIIHVGYNGTASATLTISGNTISNNAFNGIFIFEHENTDMTVTISGNTMTGNKDGVTFAVFDDSVVSAAVSGNTITGSARDGIWLENYGNTILAVAASRNTITGNAEDGIYFPNVAPGNLTADFGGGGLGSIGYNSIFNNGDCAAETDAVGAPITAKYNWWGQAPPDAGKFDGDVDYSDWLSSSP